MKRLATVTTWERYFEEKESIRISDGTIKNRLVAAKKIGVTARNKIGIVVKNGFYSEIDVREVCADLLQPLPQADESGFFEKEGIRYGTINTYAKRFKTSHSFIARRLETSGLQTITGREVKGHICDFYPEPEVEKICAEFLKPLPRADENGLFEREGIRYGTIKALSRVIAVDKMVISRRLKSASIRSIKGKVKTGHICDFYPEPEVEKICKESDRYKSSKALAKESELSRARLEARAKSEPQGDKDGFFELNGKKYGLIYAWPKILPISPSELFRRVKKSQIKGIKGKTKRGKIKFFYAESQVRELCGSLLITNLPQANKKGFFKIKGVKYGTIAAWAKALPISQTGLTSRLTKAQKKAIDGKDSVGHVLKQRFFNESDVLEVCSDLTEDLPHADANGVLKINGENYNTIVGWERILPISNPSITSRLKKFNKQGIKGRDNYSHIQIFYSESDVLEACSDLLDEDLLQANKEGFFEKNGVLYGMIYTWSKTFSITASAIKKRLQKSNTTSILGKDSGGHIIPFYSEPDVSHACADILEKRKSNPKRS